MPSHVGGPGRVGRRAFSDTAGQPVWIKQEPGEEAHGGPDTGWSQSGDGQSDSSNSSSNIYPMMMHQNPAAFSSNPVFPGFSSASGSGSQHGFPHSRPGTSGAANPYANPMPGTSQSMDSAGTKMNRRNEEDQEERRGAKRSEEERRGPGGMKMTSRNKDDEQERR
ncbi:hypothetical protein ACOMHN_022970 [Nucella lapillus]